MSVTEISFGPGTLRVRASQENERNGIPHTDAHPVSIFLMQFLHHPVMRPTPHLVHRPPFRDARESGTGVTCQRVPGPESVRNDAGCEGGVEERKARSICGERGRIVRDEERGG